MNRQDRARGALVGLAIGDAIGMPLEFKMRGEFIPVDGMEAGGPFDLPLGYWTDDTSMALCLADSLLECGGYDSFDVMSKYLKWEREGYRSSMDVCFDIGRQTSQELDRFAKGEKIVPVHRLRTDSAGNGAIMRLAPIVIAAGKNESNDGVYKKASISARETHYSWMAQAAASHFASIMYLAISHPSVSKVDTLKFPTMDTFPPYQNELRKIHHVISCAADKDESDLTPTGYVVDSLEVAVWAYLKHDNFASGMLAAVNQGGDSDTIGAIYGQIAGAYYGYEGIPIQWKHQLFLEGEICQVADGLYDMDTCPILKTRFEEDGNQY